MEWSEQDISLIDDYLTGNLSGDALAGFEARLSAEPALAEAVEAQRAVMGAARLSGREALRENLQAIHLEVVGSIGIKDYTPSQGRGGNSFLNGLISLILVGAIAAISYYIFVVLNVLSPREKSEGDYIPSAPAPKEQTTPPPKPEVRINETTVDTVRIFKDADGNIVSEERVPGVTESDTIREH